MQRPRKTDRCRSETERKTIRHASPPPDSAEHGIQQVGTKFATITQRAIIRKTCSGVIITRDHGVVYERAHAAPGKMISTRSPRNQKTKIQGDHRDDREDSVRRHDI